VSVNNGVRTSDFVSRISLEIPSEGITFKDFLELIGEQGFLMSLERRILFPGSLWKFPLTV